MKRSMFVRFFSVVLVVVLVVVVIMSVLFYVSVRQIRIDNRMNTLKVEARELAYLARSMDKGHVTQLFGQTGTAEYYAAWKAQKILDEYGAYALLANRWSTGIPLNSAESDELQAVWAGWMNGDMAEYVIRLYSGEELVLQTQTDNGVVFTVAVPWVRDGVVNGAIILQTNAQTIHALYAGLLWQIAAITGAILAIVAVILILHTRRLVRPLDVMAKAAGEMADGKFDTRVPIEGSSEMCKVAESFNQMAEQLQNLEQSRREFVANVSHELRSPITSIHGFADGMLDDTIPPESHKQYLQVIVDETRRLTKLIAGLLNLSRMENTDNSLSLTNFDINETARRVLISRMTQIDDKQLEVDVDMGEDALMVRADSDQIDQVIINLIDNAIKFTPKGGTLTLKTYQEGDQVLLRVSDTGEGVLPKDAPHIFDRFYKADKAHTVGNGTGLGLAICRCIMERHHQKIYLLPSEIGATFEITLAHAKEA